MRDIARKLISELLRMDDAVFRIRTMILSLRRIATQLRSPAPSERELCLARALKDEIARLTPLAPASDPAVRLWTKFRNQLRKDVARRDPRFFLMWPVIHRTMSVHGASYVSVERAAIEGSAFRSALVEDRVGHPPSSDNLIHHAYHLQQFSTRTSMDIASVAQVVEIGGGYGSMCRLVRRFSDCAYHVVDLPEFAALQRYFLGCLQVSPEPEIVSAPFELSLDGAIRPTLLIATWSLSEMPLAERQRTMDALPDSDAFLIGYQNEFEGIDNVDYFARFRASRPGHRWVDVPIAHVAGNRYLFGIRDHHH